VYEGQIWASSEQMTFAVEALASSPVVRAVDANGLSLLSKREMEVVRSLAEGLTNREIAERLGLSQHTIKNYLFRVYDKLGVSSRLELLFLTLTQADSPQLPGSIAPKPSLPRYKKQDSVKPASVISTAYPRPTGKISGNLEDPDLRFPASTVERKDLKLAKQDHGAGTRAKPSTAFMGTDPLD
jgi:DNA-binding CsgD family transcriptional regulator